MRTQTDQPQKNKSKAVANNLGPPHSPHKSASPFVDNRTEAVLLRKIQAMTGNNQESNKDIDKANNSDNIHPPTVQRVIETLLPTKFYRRKGGSNSSKVNEKIKQYNTAYRAGTTTSAALLGMLNNINGMLNGVSKSKKEKVDIIRAEVAMEKLKIEAPQDVMALAASRAKLQNTDPLLRLEQDDSDANDFMRSREVLHSTNPLKSIEDGLTVGDRLAMTNEIQNIHQTHQSMMGSNSNSDKRRVAEVGMFYPEKYRRASFSRTSHENKTDTKGIGTKLPPSALPKYGAVNLANSPYGALRADDDMQDAPLHFAIKPGVLRERTTFTSGDSLREWVPNESNFNALKKDGMIRDEEVPHDAEPWNMGPVATYDAGNFDKLLRASNNDPEDFKKKNKKNPQEYVEAQIHGELRVDRDIAHVRANFARLFGNPLFESLYSSFERQNMKIIWYFFSGNKKEAQIIQDWHDPKKTNAMKTEWENARKIWVEYWGKVQRGAPENLKAIKNSGMLTGRYIQDLAAIWDTFAKFKTASDTSGEDITPNVISKDMDFDEKKHGEEGRQPSLSLLD